MPRGGSSDMPVSKEKVEYFALVAERAGGLGVIISVVYLALRSAMGIRSCMRTFIMTLWH
ncbi:MAG: hypothetical protein ACU84Q_01440 [Gammaproteobacteria bacterium]